MLEEFIVGNADLERLELLLRKFNLFEALKLVWHEVRHSDFLAYLLDPQQNHGLGDRFLKAFLQSALKGGTHPGVSPVDIDVWNLATTEVRREWGNIDIFVHDETNRLAVVIENKVQSTEHSDQLARYYDLALRECPDWRMIAIYLTLDRETPSDERFIPMSYANVCALVQHQLELQRSMLNSDVRMMLEHYAEMIRRYLVEESEISELCRRIYSKHKQALDLIYEHRPDRQLVVREFIEQWLKQDSSYVVDHCSKTEIKFIPKQLDGEALRCGSGWTRSGRILLFDVYNEPDSLRVTLIIGPGPEDVRRRLFELAQARKPPFQASGRLWKDWNTILNHRLLNQKDYALLGDEFTAELEKKWKRFIDHELPPIVAAFDDQTWIRGTGQTS